METATQMQHNKKGGSSYKQSSNNKQQSISYGRKYNLQAMFFWEFDALLHDKYEFDRSEISHINGNHDIIVTDSIALDFDGLYYIPKLHKYKY